MTTILENERAALPAVTAALKRAGHEVFFAETKEEACAKALDLIGDSATVGVPGTLTVRQIGLIDALRQKGITVYEHWAPVDLSKEEGRSREVEAQWYVTGANALTVEGQLLSADGYGNRVAAMCCCKGHRLYILGLNKLCPTLAAAFNRVRAYAAVQNALRFYPELADKDEELAAAADNLCRAFVMIEKAPQAPEGGRSVVLLVGESLGY